MQDSDVLQGGRQEALAVGDMILVDSVTIPETGYSGKKDERCVKHNLGSRIGRVTAHVVLTEYIVFTTDLNKVFCYPTNSPLDITGPIELTTFYTASLSEPFRIHGLLGAFTRFAVITQEGYLLIAFLELLHAFTSNHTAKSLSLPAPTLIVPPQAKSIVSVAFGDHHFLTQHIDGTIAAYGEEPRRCGALGLGFHDTYISKMRGVKIGSSPLVGNHLPEGEGRTIWFEPLKATWLEKVSSQGALSGECEERLNLLDAGHEDTRKAYADYFEKEGAKWEESLTNDGEMGAYFVLKIAAGGWSSAALVLVDEEKAEKAREAHKVRRSPDTIPPSPALSTYSNDSYEVIESPGEQLSNAIYAIYEWTWSLGRSFLGLIARDAKREAESKVAGREGNESEVEYVWSKKPFPRLRYPDGTAMPGEIPLTE